MTEAIFKEKSIAYKKGFFAAESDKEWTDNPYIRSAATIENVQKEIDWNRGFEESIAIMENKR